MYLGQGEQAHEAADKIALVCDLFSRYSGLPCHILNDSECSCNVIKHRKTNVFCSSRDFESSLLRGKVK